MILIDYSQIAISNIFADREFQEAAKNPSPDSKNFLKHMILNTIRSYKMKYSQRFGSVVLCVDGQNSWRRQAWPLYKAARRAGKEKSDIDFDFVYEVLNETLQDLNENFPFPVVKVNAAEGDDIIACLTKYITENRTKMVGVYDEAEPILIVSSDGDFKQLQKFTNVKQFSPMQKKEVKCDDPEKQLLEKILVGDAGDGVPNICSDDDVFVTEGKRQTPFMKKRFDEFHKKGIEACKSDTEKRNFQRNELLISFEKIPNELREEIINVFLEQEKSKKESFSQSRLLNYFVKNRMKLMIDDATDFVV